MRQRAADSVIDVARYRNFYEQTERECDTLRAQLLESQQDLREEEKRHRKAAVDRDEFAAKLHLADQDRQILSDCRAALRDQLADRDAEIGRLRTLDEKTVRAGANVARKLDDALARLSELEPVAEAVQEYRDTIGTPQNMAANRRVLFGVPLPKKGPQP
jgi:predicted  nucleic acid-binding Zn-ribbon protein